MLDNTWNDLTMCKQKIDIKENYWCLIEYLQRLSSMQKLLQILNKINSPTVSYKTKIKPQ